MSTTTLTKSESALQNALALAPAVLSMLQLRDPAFLLVSDTNTVVYASRDDRFDLGIREGHQVNPQWVVAEAMCEKRPASKLVDLQHSTLGVAYIGYAVPLFEDEKVVGGIGWYIATHTEEIRRELAEISQVMQDVEAVAHNIAEASMSLAADAERLNEAAGQLHGQSSNMAGASKLLHEISSRTQMLGLNAAIESARAGEYGKGFSVVADEVRKLATEAKSSTGQITAQISSMQKSIETVQENAAQNSVVSEEMTASIEELASSVSSVRASVEKVNQWNQGG